MSTHQAKLPWLRFWCPLGSTLLSDGDDAGFLYDPADELGRHVNPCLRTLPELLSKAGPLVLCGEPGLGKSTELEAVRATIKAEHAADGGGTCWLRFQGIVDFADFRKRSVEIDAWQQWRQGQGRFTLVVDGVDEGLLRVANFVSALHDLLEDEPTERLRLILACRTREWPVETGSELLSLWSGDADTRVYELCPLRRADVRTAAKSRQLQPTAFLQAVYERQVVPLATRPITLFFLLDEYAQASTLPQTHRELYQRATERLSREVNQKRLETLRSLRASSAVSDADRLRAAQRLACLLLVCGGTGIRAATAEPSALNSDLPVDAAVDESAGGVSARALEEALETALFTSLGAHRFGFIHRTVAEYLASEHLRVLPLVQLRRLLCQRDQNGEHVIPQLAELAAWVAGSNEHFGEHVLKIEPEVLLRSDVVRKNDHFKSLLVEAVLKGAREERIFDKPGFSRFLSGLTHPGLEAQLRPVISNPQAHFVERRIAMSIAAECRCAGLTDCLLARVQDASDDEHLRERAADALAAAVSDDQVTLLEPLARGEIQPDSDDSIKGEALRRLVPKFWKVRDALPHLDHQKNSHHFGSYWIFLNQALPDALETDDLLPVLEWLRGRGNCLSSQATFHRLASVAFAKALRRLHEPAIAVVVVQLWQAWSEGDLHHLPEDSDIRAALEEADLRRNLATRYFNDPSTALDQCLAAFYPIQLLRREPACLDWLLDQVVQAPSDRRPIWTDAINYLARDPAVAVVCWDKLFLRIGEIPELADRMVWLTRVWDLDEPDARTEKERYMRDQRSIAQQEKPSSRDDEAGATAAIQAVFERYAQGDNQAWHPLWTQLVLEDWRLKYFSTSDLSTCPRWALLTAEQQTLVPQIARAYLLSSAHQPRPLNQQHAAFWPARCAACLLRETLADDQPLRESILSHWLDVVVFELGSRPEVQRDLFRRVYALAPERVLPILAEKARSEATEEQLSYTLRVASAGWNRPFSELALSIIRESTDGKYVCGALHELAKADPDAALDYCQQVIAAPPRPDGTYLPALSGALVIGLLRDADRFWAAAEAHLRANEPLARTVLQKVCQDMDLDHRASGKPPSVETLGKLFELLHHWYPPSGDPPRRQGGEGVFDSVRHLRGRLPGMIAARANDDACRELLRLAAAVPADEATWIRSTYREALTGLRRGQWRAPRAAEVKQVLSRAQARLLASEDDLLELIVESLDRLQNKLKWQSLPQAENLWSWEGGGLNRENFRHKDEEALSDYVANWLSEDLGPTAGVVVGREVQPRRGSRTDIMVEASTLPSKEFERLTVIIEVKGCWHPEVRTGLRSQLADGYLKEQRARCGVYLVGWFKCPQWKDDDTKLQSATLADAQREVADLAAGFDGTASPYHIKAYVLDCTLPPPQSPSARKRR